MNRIFLLALIYFIAISAYSQQIGGRTSYAFLNLPTSARVSALGNQLITVADDDINFGVYNPALLNSRMHRQLTFNHSFLVGGIQHGYSGYGHYLSRLNATLQLGVQYIDYGKLEATNEFFQNLGEIRAKESAFLIGAAIPLDERISAGINARFISSTLGTLQSIGLSTDLGILYQDTTKKLSVALTARHLGTQLSTYTGISADREPLPFEMQFGISKQLRYLPFRFSLTYANLQRWNILYDDPNAENGTILFGETPREPSMLSKNVDNFFRHLIFSGELLLGTRENFRLRIAYQHRRRKELSTQGFGSAAGFSFGAGIKVNRFRLDYARNVYHLAGGTNHIGISTNLGAFQSNR